MELTIGLSAKYELTNPETHFLYETLFRMRVAGKLDHVAVEQLTWVIGFNRAGS